MADNVGYSSGTGISIAADDVGGVFYQRVKVVLGTDGTVLGDVDVTNPLPVQGTVSVSGAVGVSGTVTVLGGTVVTAQVSGTVSVLGAMTNVSTVNTVLGTVSVSLMQTSVSMAALPTVNTIVTILGTQVVSVVPGVSVNALVTGVVPGVSVTVPTIATVLTIVTVLGTQVVSMAQTSMSIAVLPTVSTVVTVLGTVSVSQVGYLFTTTGITTGTAQAVWIMNPTTVTVTVSQPFGDAIGFYLTTVSAPTVITPALMSVAWLGTVVQTSMYVVPAGRRLRIQAVCVQAQNTAASVGVAVCIVEVRASLSSSVTVGPIVVYMAGGAKTNATNAGGGEAVQLAVDVSTGYSVGFGYRATGGTGHLVSFSVIGELF